MDVIYLDYSKASDRASHEKLLFKLECLGIGGSLLAWLRSYLSGRRHRVVIDNKSSDFLPVTSHVIILCVLEFSFHDSSYYTVFSLSPQSSVFCWQQRGKNYKFQKLYYPLEQNYGLKKIC